MFQDGRNGLRMHFCRLDFENMNMSMMDKSIALSSTEGTRERPSEKCKNEVPRAWELEYEHVHGQTDSAE